MELKLSNLEKSFGEKKVLHGISLKVESGSPFGFLGRNGAGKTTLMKCILGLLGHRGEITLDGAAITRKNIARLSFATSEHSFFPALSPADHRDFYQSQFPAFRAKRFVALTDFFDLPMGKPLRAFSTGQKNQFEVILALCQGADYILMDEPFAGNDVFNRDDFYKVLLGILEPTETVLLSTHLLEEVAPFLSRAVLLRQGRLVGDVLTADLDEQGSDLMTYVRGVYHRPADRVSRALSSLTGEEAES